MTMKRILSVLLENEPGSLSRVVGLFSQRNYNIESLCVAPTQDQTLSRLTLATRGDDAVIEQIIKQLNKLIEVYKVTDITEGRYVERELLLLKVRGGSQSERAESLRVMDVFRGQVVDISGSVYVIQLAGTSDKIDAFIEAIGARHIIELVRTGISGIARGEKALTL